MATERTLTPQNCSVERGRQIDPVRGGQQVRIGGLERVRVLEQDNRIVSATSLLLKPWLVFSSCGRVAVLVIIITPIEHKATSDATVREV